MSFRERFKALAIVSAISGIFGARQVARKVAPVVTGDDYSHPRSRVNNKASRATPQYRRHRAIKNAMARESRRRNREGGLN